VKLKLVDTSGSTYRNRNW